VNEEILEYPQILVLVGVLEGVPHRHRGTTISIICTINCNVEMVMG
jgi:hypothetical protein